MKSRSITMVSSVLVALSSCAGPAPSFPGDQPIDFAFETNGEVRRIADLAGRPIVLVLMRTSELASHAYMDQVVEAYESTAGKIRFVVLTIEAREAPFVAPFVEFESLPFPIGVAEESVARGNSPLGIIPIVPSTYLIDSSSRVVEVGVGIVRADELVRMIKRELL